MKLRTLAWLLAGTGALFATVAAPEVRSEITNLTEQSGPRLATGQRLVSSDTVTLQCWQQGVRIINEDELGGLSVSTLLQQQSVSFGAATGQSPTVVLLSLAEATCIVRSKE